MTKNGTLDLPPHEELIKARLKKKVEELGSITKVEKDAGIPYVTVHRAVSWQEGDNSYGNTKAFLEYIANDTEEFEMFMLHYFPEEAEFWSKLFLKGGIDGEIPGISTLIEDCYKYYFIYSLAGIDTGMPMTKVEKLWGQEGVKKAGVLVTAGYLQLEEDILIRPIRDVIYVKPETTLSVIQHHIQHFDTGLIKDGLAGLFHVLKGFNEKGIREYRQLMIDTSTRVLKMSEDDQYKGDIPAHFSIITGKVVYDNKL